LNHAEEVIALLVVAVRTFILYLSAITVVRIMGKRQLGELQPYDLVVAIVIAEIVAIPLGDTGIPLVHGIIALLVLLATEVALSVLSLRSEGLQRWISGTPSLLIRNGRVDERELRRLRVNVNDLMEQMRGSGYLNLSDVGYAILETNGKLSVIPRPEHRQVTPEDLGHSPPEQQLPVTVICDGVANPENLGFAGLTEGELANKLRDLGYNDVSKIFIAQVDSHGDLFVQQKEQAK